MCIFADIYLRHNRRVYNPKPKDKPTAFKLQSATNVLPMKIPDEQYVTLTREIRIGSFRAAYVLSGEETFYCDLLADEIERRALDDAQRDFNQVVMYGKETEAKQIIEACNQYPMMSERVVVIVKEAHLIDLDGLIPYLKKPHPTTVLVLVHPKKLDGRRALAKTVKKLENVAFLDSKMIYDNQLPEFINYRLKELDLTADAKVEMILSDYLGNDLHRINNEIKKLAAALPVNTKITSDIIEEYVGISKIYNPFELNSALLNRDLAKCAIIVKGFEANPKKFPLLVIVNIVYLAFSKLLLLHSQKITNERAAASVLRLPPMFASEYVKGTRHYSYAETLRAISLLRKFDRISKGIGGNQTSDSLTELICMIMSK